MSQENIYKEIPKILTPADVLKFYPAFTESYGTLANLRAQKRGPKFFRVSRKVVYRREDIESYIFKRPVMTADAME